MRTTNEITRIGVAVMAGNQGSIRYNDEHYRDETARQAIQRAEGNQDARLSTAIHAARATLQRFGFDVVDRIVVADRKSGRIYR